MSQVRAVYSRIAQQGTVYKTLKNTLNSSKSELSSVKHNMSQIHYSGYEGIQKRLSDVVRQTEQQVTGTASLSTFLAEAATLYSTAEARIAHRDVVSKYTSDKKAGGLFFSYTDGFNYVSKMNMLDAALMTFFKQFDISKDQILKIIDGKGYQYKAYESIIDSTLEEICKNADYDSEVERFKKALKMVKEGKSIADYLTKDEYQIFKQFLKAFGTDLDAVTGTLDIADTTIDVLSKLFGDYSKNLDILKSLKSMDVYNGNDVASKVIDDMIVSYQDKMAGAMNTIVGKLVDGGYDTAVSALADASPVMAAVKGVDITIDFVGKVTGEGTYADNLAEYCNTTTLRSDAIMSFTKAYNKLQSGSYTSQDVTNFENTFVYNKQLAIKQYSLQLDLYKHCHGDYSAQIAETQQSLKQLNDMSLDNPSTWKFESSGG